MPTPGAPACRASGAGRAGLELRAGAGSRCARTGSVPNPRGVEAIVPRWRSELTRMREAKESQDQHSAAPDRPTAQRFSSTLALTGAPLAARPLQRVVGRDSAPARHVLHEQPETPNEGK